MIQNNFWTYPYLKIMARTTRFSKHFTETCLVYNNEKKIFTYPDHHNTKCKLVSVWVLIKRQFYGDWIEAFSGVFSIWDHRCASELVAFHFLGNSTMAILREIIQLIILFLNCRCLSPYGLVKSILRSWQRNRKC